MYLPEYKFCLERPIGSAVLEPLILKLRGNQTLSDQLPMQLPASELQGPGRIYGAETVAVINKSIEELETVNGLIFEDDLDDLDFYKLAMLQIGLEKYILERHLHDQPGVTIRIAAACTSLGEAIDAFLTAFDMTSGDLSWYHDSVHLPPHELWRQDDNGNKVLIETLPIARRQGQKLEVRESWR